jgi:hypothetical protein
VAHVPPGKAEKTDAILVRLEHANGEAVDVFLPLPPGRVGRLRGTASCSRSRGKRNLLRARRRDNANPIPDPCSSGCLPHRG